MSARPDVATAKPYAHPWEHLEDELRRLDVLIGAGLDSLPAPPDDPALDPFRGLVVTESEAAALLERGSRYVALSDEQERTLARMEEAIALSVAATLANGGFLPLCHLQRTFRLSQWEMRCFVAALAPDLDRKYEKLYAYLQDDMTSKHATVDLLLRLCCRSERERIDALPKLSSSSTLSRMLFRPESPPEGAARSALARPIRADERIVSFVQLHEWRYEGPLSGIRRYDPDETLPALLTDTQEARKLERHLATSLDKRAAAIYMLYGPKGSGKTLQARCAAAAVGMPLLEWDVSRAPAEEEAFRYTIRSLLREARLSGAIPAFDRLHAAAREAEAKERKLEWLAEALVDWRGPVFLLSEMPWAPDRAPPEAAWIEVALDAPDPAVRQRLWHAMAGEAFRLDETTSGALAAKFRFTPGRIADTVRAAVALRAWEGEPGERSGDPVWLHRAGYRQVRHRLGERAVKLEPKFDWDDLVLPDDTKALLRQACNRLLYRHVVFGEWGFERKFAYGKGISMLFTGPPGTGKTMSAMIMAKAMNAELYRIDLSRMVSKYIGETEKNLHDVFEEAQLSGAILFFDEADALFGKRSEVKDAHDKYANMETSYLLQKMEEYDGLTILATNFAQNLDEAFTRRIQFIVKFPFPDAAQRELLWRSAFPKPLLEGTDIDFAYLANAFDLAGGPIKNVVLTAAFLAAEAGERIGMTHMVEAVKQEYRKTGKVLLKDRLGAYA